MPRVDLVVETKVERSPRVRQVEGLFDVPAQDKLRREWHADLPLDEREWNVGLIVGPSGSGKSSVLNFLFGRSRDLEWKRASVIDDFDGVLSIETVVQALGAVGFNTVPSWMKPFSVLSSGERFRVEVARRMLETEGIIAIDEFTSVVDRQVAKIGSYAVQKFVRKSGKKFVAAACHYDLTEWLLPDWTLEPETMTFTWRSLRRRPKLEIEIAKIEYGGWRRFAPFHYLTDDLNKSARCFGLFCDGTLACFAGVLHKPHARNNRVKGVSRLVTLPDFQGLGLAFVLIDALGAAYTAREWGFHIYPAHPSLTRAADRNHNWRMTKRPGTFSPRGGKLDTGSRPCATFKYVGEKSTDYATQLSIA